MHYWLNNARMKEKLGRLLINIDFCLLSTRVMFTYSPAGVRHAAFYGSECFSLQNKVDLKFVDAYLFINDCFYKIFFIKRIHKRYIGSFILFYFYSTQTRIIVMIFIRLVANET